MDQREFKELLAKYLKNQCSKEEKEQLDALFDFYTKKNHWITWDEQDPEAYENTLLSDIKKDIRHKALKAQQQSAGKRLPWLKVAASVAIVLGIGLLGYLAFLNFSPEPDMVYVTKSTDLGQKTSIVLSDGSAIKLNSGSSLTFPEKFEEGVRKVSLSGEAFFEVRHNAEKPFIIETGDLTTTVLGTSFNINAYPEQEIIEVTVATGKVKVDAPSLRDASAGILQPSQQAVYHRSTGSVSTHTVSTAHFLAWKEGTIIFDDIPLSEAMEILERWFNMEILFENPAAGDCYISNRFSNENLVNILESIKFINNGIDYRFQEKNKILITGTCHP